MKSLLKKLAAIVFLVCLACATFLQNPTFSASVDVLPTMTTQSDSPNRIWVGTFQLVWNEMIDNIVKGPVEFYGYDSPMATSLNAREFTNANLSESAYYTKYGIVSPKLRKTIEKGIKKKFHEKSDILSSFDWTYSPDKYFIYAMLKKDFKFLTAFDKLDKGVFGKNPQQVDYFGIKSSSNSKLYNNVSVLFYNSPSDYAVKLKTKGNDEVILYRTDADMTFDKYYSEIQDKSKVFNGDKKMVEDETLAIPDINLYMETKFPELEGHQIKNTNLEISGTIETVDFKMNNEGVKLKSEAAVMVKVMSLPARDIRHFNFNDNFVLFLVEQNQNVPYYAMKVSDVAELNKTGRK